jgi:hypothetical protein
MAGLPQPGPGRRSARPWADALTGVGLIAAAAIGLGAVALVLTLVLAALW